MLEFLPVAKEVEICSTYLVQMILAMLIISWVFTFYQRKILSMSRKDVQHQTVQV